MNKVTTANDIHVGMMGDGTEEQNRNQHGNPELRISEGEVDTAFTRNLLYSAITLGKRTLRNHVVMAPMTRNRAIGNVPNDLMTEYYAQRASAGLIVTEGTSPSPMAWGIRAFPAFSPQNNCLAGRRSRTRFTKAVRRLSFN